MRFVIAGLLVAAGYVLAVTLHTDSPRVSPTSSTPPAAPAAPAGDFSPTEPTLGNPDASSFDLVPGAPSEISDDYTQFYGVEVGNENELQVETTEIDGANEFVTTDVYTTAFDIKTIGTRFADEFFVGGRTSRGWGVIEKWRRGVTVGGPVTTLGPGSAAPNPIGTPTTPVQSFARVFAGGGGYIQLPNRDGDPRLQRTEIVLGPSIPVPDEIGVDPEGRFLLMIGDDGDLYQIDLAVNEPTLDLVYESIDVPPLANACTITVGQHQSYGRMWFVRSEICGGSEDAILFDYDNDGVFDDFLMSTSLEIAVSDYYDNTLISFY